MPVVPARVGALVTVVALVTVGLALGCSSTPPMTTSDPPASLRLQRLLEFYRSYTDEKKKPPADEAALKDYIRGLPGDRKEGFGMPENVDELFISPRDKQKYVVRYKVKWDVGGETEAVAWEEKGEGGMRYVALNVGYVQEYDEQGFQELKKK